MKKIIVFVFRFFLIAFFLCFLFYALLPTPHFPEPMNGFSQSFEPADVETPLRRGYYTNYSRQEVMDYYLAQFKKPTLFGISLFSYRLNYPPEEAQTLIRDQTKSTFLEEIVHPLRESVYINGFEPVGPEYAINIKGVPWRQKIIVRYVSSGIILRSVVVFLSGIAVILLIKTWTKKN
jgi:hypothetical protein